MVVVSINITTNNLQELNIQNCPLLDSSWSNAQAYSELEYIIETKNKNLFKEYLNRPDFDKIVTDKKKLLNKAVQSSGIITKFLLDYGYSVDDIYDYNGILTANAGFRYYKGSGYFFMNNMLRTNVQTFDDFRKTHPKFVKLVELMLKEMKKNTRNDSPWLYRGIPRNFFNELITNGDKPVNEQFLLDKSFCSTSLSKNVSAKFTNEEGCCMMRFQLPNNIHFYSYVDENPNDYEQEVLLEPNIKINFINTEIEDGITYYNCYLTKMSESSVSPEIADFIRRRSKRISAKRMFSEIEHKWIN